MGKNAPGRIGAEVMDLTDRELEMLEGAASRHSTELTRYLTWIDDLPALPERGVARQRVKDEAREYMAVAIKLMDERRRRRSASQ